MNPEFMQKALKLTRRSGRDVPIGAVIVKNGEIIAKAINRREKRQNVLYHAEILAIKRASGKLGNWHLDGCEMYVTLEPCPMCASAILQARIKKVYFGAYDLLYGAFGSKCDMRTIMGYDAEVIGGIMEEDCSRVIKNFFEALR